VVVTHNENNTENDKDCKITAALQLKIRILAKALKCFLLLLLY